MSRIEEMIEEIERYIDDCKFQPLSNTKIIVNKDQLEEYLEELKARTPEEIRRYQKIISNKEAILADAQAKADAIIAEAQVHTSELVSEHQIMQQAYAKANEMVMLATNEANEILDQATADANEIRSAAIAYTDEMLHSMENMLSHALDTSRAKYDNLIQSLENCYQIVSDNRKELCPPEDAQEEKAASDEEPQPTEEDVVNALKGHMTQV